MQKVRDLLTARCVHYFKTHNHLEEKSNAMARSHVVSAFGQKHAARSFKHMQGGGYLASQPPGTGEAHARLTKSLYQKAPWNIDNTLLYYLK